MTARGKTIGILSVYRQAKRPYSREDIALLDSVADQIGTAVENTRLHLENERLLIVKERNRLARELHDAVTQSLYSLTLHAETSMRFVKSGQPDLASEYIEKVAETSQQALREMRLLLHNLRPAVLEHLGLVKAIRQRLDAVEKRVGVVVDYQVEGQIDLPAHVEEALYHIVQEALNNTLKHAAATQISLRLHQHEASVALTISDNGKGFRLLELSDNGGLGLTSMRERVDSLGGDLNIDTRVGGGSRIQVELDLGHVKEFVDSHDVIDLL
jgi:signal transduction histidine kinase